jgi:hypothetical protein
VPDESGPHLPAYIFKIPFNSILSCKLDLPASLITLGSVLKICVRGSAMRATCPTHLIFLDFIILIIFAEKYMQFTTS